MSGGYGAYLDIAYDGSTGRRVGLDESVPVVGSVTGAFGQSEVWSTVPPGAASMSVDLVLNGTGAATFDDLALSEIAPPIASYRRDVHLSPTTIALDRISIGLGVETNPFEFSPLGALTSERATVLTERLHVLRPAWARVFVATDWFSTPAGLDFSGPMAKALLDDVELYRSLHARVNLVLWQASSWAPPYGGLAADLVALLRWLEENHATNVGLLTLANEPDLSYIPGTGSYGEGFPTPFDYEEALHAVRRALDQAGFASIGLVGGDVAVPADGFVRAVASALAGDLGELSFHLYIPYPASLCVPTLQASEMARLGVRDRLRAVLWESNLQGGVGGNPTFSPGEVGRELLSATYPDALKLAAFYLQALAAGVGGISYWEAMDMTYPGQLTMRYGLWGSSGPPRPAYYALGLLARFLVPGSTVRAVSGGGGALVAYEAVDLGGQRAIYMINPWATSVMVRPDLPAGGLSERLLGAATVQRSEASGALRLPAQPVNRSIELPPESMGVVRLAPLRSRSN